MSENFKPLIMIMGDIGSGKSTSFRNIPNQERWAYANTDAGKPLPFRHKFKERKLTNSDDFLPFIHGGENSPNIDGMVVDTLTMMLDLNYLENQQNEDFGGYDKFNEYDMFIKSSFLQGIGTLTKPLIIAAHVKDQIVEGSATKISIVPVKGQNKSIGLEGFATLVVHAKKIPIDKLKPYDLGSPLLNITEKDVRRGYKHVFQTRTTTENMHERLRAPFEFFDDFSEVFIDNDIMHIIRRWDEYYGTSYAVEK